MPRIAYSFARLVAAVLLFGLGAPGVALANPRALPFTYPYATLPKGSVEVEAYVDLDPVRALSTSTGASTFFVASQLQAEFEVGLSDHVELGLYATTVPRASETFAAQPILPEGNGAKQRIRGRVAEEGAWPIDVALYGEVVENEREIELEAKAILARRIGNLHVDLNLSAELELYYSGSQEVVFNPSAGVTYQVAPLFHPGLEYWVRAELPIGAPRTGFNRGPHHYVGPAMMFNFGRAWWSAGAYYRLSDIGHQLEPGDAFGPLWFRTIVGLNF